MISLLLMGHSDISAIISKSMTEKTALVSKKGVTAPLSELFRAIVRLFSVLDVKSDQMRLHVTEPAKNHSATAVIL